MRFPLAILALLPFATASVLPSKLLENGKLTDQLYVTTTVGRVRGKIDPAYPGVRQFLGIPYAQPPVDELRWKPPTAQPPSSSDIDATSIPPSCQQFLNNNASSAYINDVLEYNVQGLNRTGLVSEDCLKLSIWAPNLHDGKSKGQKQRDKGFPVIVFIYGGGYATGGIDVPAQIPAP